jgi:putative ABC transport system permease protein
MAVIGTDVRNTIFSDGDPIGKTIRIADVPLQVIGVLKSRGAAPAGGSLDNVILIPVNTASRRLFNRDYLTMVIAQLKDPAQSDAAANRVTSLLRERHRIQPPALDDFAITNPAATVARVTQASSMLARVLTGVAIMALLIGGIVIMSLMSIAVAERRREIAVRRSVGASRDDIVFQFLLEAVAVALAGGILGVLLPAGGMQIASWLQRLPPVLLWQPIATAVLLSIVIGIVFGIYPAWKASRVDPIQALRP